jgi:Predicted flavoprotein involved in K+ transport
VAPDGVDFAGKRVALIGTGSTGIQATPVIAREADHLYVFQRTPNYSIPARNYTITPEQMDEIKANYAGDPAQVPGVIRRLPVRRNDKSAMEVTPRNAWRPTSDSGVRRAASSSSTARTTTSFSTRSRTTRRPSSSAARSARS